MGNRQGGKTIPRPEFYQQRNRKRTGNCEEFSVDADPLLPNFQPSVSQFISVHCVGASLNSVFHSQSGRKATASEDSDPTCVSRAGIHVAHSLLEGLSPKGIKHDITAAGGSNPSTVTCSHASLHSPSVLQIDSVKSSNLKKQQDKSKEEFAMTQMSPDIPSSISFPKHLCLEADPHSEATGVRDSSTVVNNMATNCIDRLENLKRNIEQCKTENVTHFNNAGFAQLLCEAGYGDYDNADNSTESNSFAHRRNKSMSPKGAVLIGVSHFESKNKFKAVRKLSEPGQFVHRQDSLNSKSVIPGVWSKSAENSPVIVRKALPNPGSPVIVQRTPSQSPSVERRFPANAAMSSVVSGNGAESPDSPVPKRHVFPKMLSTQQDCLEAREASLSIRQKATAEISLPCISNSPVSARKMPESPILLSSGTQQQGSSQEQTPSNQSRGDRNMPAVGPPDTSRLLCMRALLSSPCSSPFSGNPSQKQSSPENNGSPLIPVCTSSTSSPPCASPLTPILLCTQPKGTPIRTCTMVSQPCTAVVIASRESLQSVDEAVGSTAATETASQNVSDQQCDHTGTQDVHASPRKQHSDSALIEDSIKQNSQSAVFGSVSPKLLRHRRLMKENSNSIRDQHTFPKHSHSMKIPSGGTCPTGRENRVLDTEGTEFCVDMDIVLNGDKRLAELSHSAPSSFPCYGAMVSDTSAGNKTLGQRIREVITEATTEASVDSETVSMQYGKRTKTFSKDDIFASISASDKSSCSFVHHPAVRGQTVAHAKTLHFRNENQTTFAVEKHAGNIIQGTHLRQNTGHSYHLKSSRDSCSSCVSDSSQMDSYDNSLPGVVAELSQANLSRQTKLLSGGLHMKEDRVPGTRGLGVPGQRLVSSDTSDTLSTDRDTSSSSKRESSTSTATDDTLTSFKTRSTADSADYEEGFVLPQSLVFIRSAKKDMEDHMCFYESDQPTIKRKLVEGQQSERQAQHERLSHKTRTKRRKQTHIRSQVVTASRQHAEGTPTWNVLHVYSDELSDNSDLSDSKEDMSDLPSSRDDISDLCSSRDDLSQFPTCGAPHLSGSRYDTARFSCRKTTAASGFSVRDFTDTSAIDGYVFHRSDLRSSANPMQSSPDTNQPMAQNLETDYHTELSDSSVHSSFSSVRSASRGPKQTCVTVSETHADRGAGPALSEPRDHSLPSDAQLQARRPDVGVSPRPTPIRPRTGLPTATHVTASPADSAYDVDGCEQTGHTLYSREEDGQGKELLCPYTDSADGTVVFTCTIYNSACRSVDA